MLFYAIHSISQKACVGYTDQLVLPEPVVTVAIPSLNQGKFLNTALSSIFSQDVPVEVFVLDAGSTDNSLEIIRKWQDKLSGWRSHPDRGQAAAINEGIALGTAPYVAWLNSDDFYYPNALKSLLRALNDSDGPAAYGNCWNVSSSGRKFMPYLTLPFNEVLLANYCFVAQPSTLIKRSAWHSVRGLNESLQLAMDYELWWKLYREFGKFEFCRKFIAANRSHADTKTQNNVESHYLESINVVRKYYGPPPLKWKLMLPVMKALRSMTA